MGPRPNFAHAGITRTSAPPPPGFRLVERRTLLRVDAATARTVVMTWGVKTRAGFRVTEGEVAPGAEFTVRLGPVREPVRVTWVTEEGFGYETLEGHPLSGEEAFLVETGSDGRVWFVNRSVSRPVGGWRAVAPLLRFAQSFFVRRYGAVMRAL